MAKKWTIEMVREAFSKKGYELIDEEFKGIKQRVTIKDVEGFLYEITFDNFNNGSKTPCKYSKTNKYSIQNIRLWLKINNKTIEVISDKYMGSENKLTFKCTIDNNEWEAKWHNIQNGKGCPVCGVKSRVDKSRLSIDEIRFRLNEINPNVHIIEGSYENNRSKLKCKCLKDGYVWLSNWANLSRGEGCPKCANNIRLTIEGVKNKLLLINPNIEIISNTYINNKNKLECQCKVCGHKWYSRWDNLASGYGCQKCAIESISGENSYRWNNGISETSKYLRSKISEWKKDSMKKYNYKCDITGERFDVIHHLYGFDSIIKEMFENLNIPIKERICDYSEKDVELMEKEIDVLHKKYGEGVCLTNKEHEMFHKLYGYGNNTPEQYYLYKRTRLKQLNEEKELETA